MTNMTEFEEDVRIHLVFPTLELEGDVIWLSALAQDGETESDLLRLTDEQLVNRVEHFMNVEIDFQVQCSTGANGWVLSQKGDFG